MNDIVYKKINSTKKLYEILKKREKRQSKYLLHEKIFLRNTSNSFLYSHHSCVPSFTIVCSGTEPVTSLSYYGRWFWAEVHHSVNNKCDHLQGKDMSGHLGHICIYRLFLLSVCCRLNSIPPTFHLKSTVGEGWEKGGEGHGGGKKREKCW